VISELRQTIYDVLVTVSGLSSSNVFYKEAPQNDSGTTTVSVPYIVFSEVGSNYERIDTTDKREVASVQFDLFGSKYYEIYDILRDLTTTLPQEDVAQTTMQYTYTLIEV